MPTVLRVGPYSFVFFSSDRGEPAHIPVQRDRQVAKFWLDPVTLVTNRGFREHELHRIARLVEQHQPTLLKARPDLDEHIGVEGLLAGRRSGESQQSFERWLASRRARPE
jgi:hypothetical protein